MLQECFIRILNMSLTGAAVIAAVLLLRLLLRRAPKIISYCLWAVVLFRLLCPVSFSLPVSLLGLVNAPAAREGEVQYIPEDFSVASELEALSPEPGAANVVVPDEKENQTVSGQIPEEASDSLPQMLAESAAILWCAGMLAMLLYGGISLAMFKRSLKGAYELEEQKSAAEQGLFRRRKWQVPRIYCKEKLPTSFVLGLIRPRIYLPEGMTQEERQYVLLHEQIHIRRGDHIIRMVSYLTLCIHWFNPLAWAAFFFSGRDMEMSCDEAVIRRLGSHVKKHYSASLLTLATGKKIFCGAPLAFGEGDTGSRIRNVLKYKKPGAVLIGAAAVAGLLATVFLLANPGAEEEPEPGESGEGPVIAEQEASESEEQEETQAQQDSREETASEPEESGEQETQAPSEDQGGDEEEEPRVFDLRELYPSYDAETPEKQREILQSLDRGEALTLERLRELLEEPEPLLEFYAGYQETSWSETNDIMNCWIKEPEIGADLLLYVYFGKDNSISRINLERRNDGLAAWLYDKQFFSGYSPNNIEQIDSLSGTGELFLWIRIYSFPPDIYLNLRPDQFRTDMGVGPEEWSGMTYKWLYVQQQEQPQWEAGSSEWGPPEWKAPASIMRVPTQDRLTFTEGALSEVRLNYNHAERTMEWEILGGCEEQAMISMYNVDQYTLTEIDEAAQAGNPIPEEYTTADIWYVCIAREDSPWCYVLTMNQRHFSREEAEEFARSIRFREAAWE